MTSVVLTELKVDQVLQIVHELKSLGFVQHLDFDFKWEPPVYDWFGSKDSSSRSTFMLYNEKIETFFRLKYS